jgi:hypothetical protein
MHPTRESDAAARGRQIDPLAVERQLETGLVTLAARDPSDAASMASPAAAPAAAAVARAASASEVTSGVGRVERSPSICRWTCARRVGVIRSPPSLR